ncbi:hypothetical protein ACFL1E_01850 [Candidatus Omnitrophota bacterium]
MLVYAQVALQLLQSTALFLGVSFFVLFAVSKVETKGLKVFGTVIAVMIWILTASLVGFGIYASVKNAQAMKNLESQQQLEMPAFPEAQ